MKQLIALLENGSHKEIKKLSAETEKSIKDLLIEALNDLFKKYKKENIEIK
jgi:hypothetical protein